MGLQLRVQRPPIHNISDLSDRCLNIWYNVSPAIYQGDLWHPCQGGLKLCCAPKVDQLDIDRKEELILIADELGEKTTPEMKVLDLKNLILNSEKYKNNKEFMDDYLDSIISNRISYEEQARADRKSKEEQARLTAESQLEFERINLEKVKLK
ncbi:hypothetical protein TNCV_3526091 [Trichonephila clavipes]|nr:hypothetical protein TNCV_3526091 [Trichonephila clavipes]